MKFSGFFMLSEDSEEGASNKLRAIYSNETKRNIENIYGVSKLKITDVDIYLDKSLENGFKHEYDVHFILDIPGVSLEDETQEFYELEMLVGTGLSIVE